MVVFGRKSYMHPRVNATLKSRSFASLESHGSAPAGWNKDVIRTGRLRDKIAVDHLRTLRSRLRRASTTVESCDESSTEALHTREGMRFPTQVLQIQRRAFGCLHLR